MARPENIGSWPSLFFSESTCARTSSFFLHSPDCIAAVFAVGGLCLWAERRDLLLRSVCAIGLFVCAVLFKQTSAAFALIPIVYVLIWKRGLQNLFASLIPATSILVTLGIIRFIWPQVFHAMITVPGSIEVNYGHVPLISGYLIATFLVQVDRDLALLFLRCGDEKYETAVDFARRTPDRVISPQDPTIAYRGAGYFGRSLFFELDAHAVNGNWPSELPESMQREVAEAKYVVQVRSFVLTPMFEQALVKDHFYPMDFVGLRGSVYTLWTRGPE